MSSLRRHLETARSVPILWLYGADATGKSTTGWEVYRRLADDGVAAAYLDTDYLGFCTPQFPDPARLVELNLAATWPNFAAAGAECLVVSGILVDAEQRTRYELAVPGGRMTLCRLRARPDTIRSRIVRRARAEALTSGAELSDTVLQDLRAYGDRSVAFGRKLEDGDMADLVLDTDHSTPADLARAVLQYGDWPSTVARAANAESPQ